VTGRVIGVDERSVARERSWRNILTARRRPGDSTQATRLPPFATPGVCTRAALTIRRPSVVLSAHAIPAASEAVKGDSMAPTPRQQLRALLQAPTIAALGGAHDALSARIIEEVGFPGVWASSFGISLSSQCSPDADLLTMSETLEVVRHIVSAVRVPVVADCNAGFGNAVNVMRVVREFEGAGAAGICIEDNPYPKRCSLYEGWRRPLVSVREMAGKVRAAKAAQLDPTFTVIARVEGFIAEHGVEAVVERADAYAEAGADAILVHAREFAPLQEFLAAWRGHLPLVVVGTMFTQVPLAELERHGFRLVIYPNQAARAAVRAMQEVMATIIRTGRPHSVEDRIATLPEVYRLVRLDALREAERRFLSPEPLATVDAPTLARIRSSPLEPLANAHDRLPGAG
jgi:phosphoenolpyruvate phosphomutase